MRLRDVGEFGLIERLRRRAERDGRGHPGVVLGIGDDAALLRPAPRHDVVVSCDTAVEDVHFRWRDASPRWVGRRTALACLSDLAAMGAQPLAAILALATPVDAPLARIESCFAGLAEECEAVRAPVVGGNVSRADRTSLVLNVLGEVPRGRALRRDTARPGDTLHVTGVLGRAALDRARAARPGGRARHLPESRIAAGRALAGLAGRGACIDVSDGLLADLEHLVEASGVAAELDPEAVPVARGFAAACARVGRSPRRLALAGGEDYELLFTLRPGAPTPRMLSRRLGAPVTAIGRIVRGRGIRGARGRPFRHF